MSPRPATFAVAIRDISFTSTPAVPVRKKRSAPDVLANATREVLCYRFHLPRYGGRAPIAHVLDPTDSPSLTLVARVKFTARDSSSSLAASTEAPRQVRPRYGFRGLSPRNLRRSARPPSEMARQKSLHDGVKRKVVFSTQKPMSLVGKHDTDCQPSELIARAP